MRRLLLRPLGGRVSYRTLVCVICVFSAVVSNFGLNEIIAIASPILSVVYPPRWC